MVNLEPDSFIHIRNLYKGFSAGNERIDVLKGIKFDIASGESVAVLGASGIGKSTLLHILGTLDRPDKGDVLFRGKDVFKFGDVELAQFRNETVGFIFQFHHLLPEFSAVENAMMPALIKGLSRQEAQSAAVEILERVGLKDRMYNRVGGLSGGEQQRVALARAIVLKPDLLLADEPTGNLDKKSSEGVHELLMELNSELGMAMVVVTHNMELASIMSRNVTIIDGQTIET